MRRMSAPDCLMTSCGAVTLPSDFDILRPCSSSTKPWVSTTSKGARPRVPQDSSSEEWNQPRCWSRAFEIHHGVVAAVGLALDAGERREMHRVLQHEGVRRAGVEPDVENVVDLLPGVVGDLAEKALARAGGVPGIGALGLEGLDDAHFTSESSRISTKPSGFSLMNTAIGTPQARWREITQSGRDSIMPVMRFSPCAGTQRVALMALSARCAAYRRACRCPCPWR